VGSTCEIGGTRVTEACSSRETEVSHHLMNFRLVKRANIACHLRWGAGNCIGLIRFVPLLVFFLSTSSWGVDPATHISQYRHTAWRIKDGLLHGESNAITQTPDGYIWIGTSAGLMQFDGVRLAPWKPPDGSQLPSQNIRTLLTARDGSLWIGTDGGLSHWTHGGMANYLKDYGVISNILEDHRGKIWITRTRTRVTHDHGPLCQVSGSKLECYTFPSETETSGCCLGLVEDGAGTLWIGSSTALLRWRDGSLTVYPNKNLTPGTDGVEALASASDESLWVGIENAGPGMGLQRFEQGSWKPYASPGLDGSKLAITALFLDRDQALWVGTGNRGMYRIRGSRVDHFSSANGLSSNSVYSFYEDHEGSIWVGTSEGIDCFRDIPVVTFSAEEGLNEDDVVSVLSAHDGTIWVGNDASLDAIRDGAVSSIRTGKGLPGHQVTSLFEDLAGQLWVGVDDRLWIYQKRHFIEIKRSDGGHVGTAAGMTEDGEGNVWVVTSAPSKKLVRIRDFKVVEEIPVPHIPASRALAADRTAGIWLGLMNGDLARYRNGNLESFSFNHDPNVRVRQVVVNADNSVLGATAVGLIAWKDGRLQTMTVNNGLPCDNIFSFLSDENNYWLYTQCGLVEITNAQMHQWWEQPSIVLQVDIIDLSDGVRPQFPSFEPPASRSPDGRLWFANNSVLQMFDPAHTKKNLVSPPVHVEQIIADGKTYDTGLDKAGRLPLPPLIRDLEIDYTALSFVAPEKVRFRYKLEGRDRDWQDVGNRRQAFYTNLPPRHYRFRVAACNNRGVWNEAGAFLDFSISPAYYQTNWFRGLWGAAFLGLLWVAYQIRIRQLRHKFAAVLDARVNERTRIARELHDTLLQSFHGLLLHFQTGIDLLPGHPVDARKTLEIAIDRADQAINEGREAVQGLRASVVETNDLVSAVRILGEELGAADTNPNSAVFEVEVEGAPRNLHPILRDEIYRIAAEALRNAFRHAQAQRIEVEVLYGERWLRLRVRDDGKGIDPKFLSGDGRAKHYGLHGMRERAKLVGGKLAVWSKLDSGTEVELSIPASTAYATSSRSRSWLSEKFSSKGMDAKETDVNETKT
jgi:signal transduction histidine kinase/ligand-binding sensor domain-containing protein